MCNLQTHVCPVGWQTLKEPGSFFFIIEGFNFRRMWNYAIISFYFRILVFVLLFIFVFYRLFLYFLRGITIKNKTQHVIFGRVDRIYNTLNLSAAER